MKKLLRTILVTGGGIAALIGWQRWRTDQEHKELPAPGQLLDINGRKQHIRHLGNKNSDLLLLIDSGLGGYSAAWYKVLAQLPPDLQVVVIDRPGMGWSDPATTPRTSRHMAQELKKILDHLNLSQTKLILVGHSLGAFNMRLFAHLYPERVKGAILIDGAHETFIDKLPSTYLQLLGATPILRPLARFAGQLGLSRLAVTLATKTQPPEYPDNFWQEFDPQAFNEISVPRMWANYVDTVFAEFAGFTDSSKQIKTATQANPRPFKNLPLIALSSTPEITAKRIASIAPINQERFIDHWCDMQASLSQLSHQEELRLSKNSGHNIILEEPETVVQAMIDIVAQVQSA